MAVKSNHPNQKIQPENTGRGEQDSGVATGTGSLEWFMCALLDYLCGPDEIVDFMPMSCDGETGSNTPLGRTITVFSSN